MEVTYVGRKEDVRGTTEEHPVKRETGGTVRRAPLFQPLQTQKGLTLSCSSCAGSACKSSPARGVRCDRWSPVAR